MKRTLSLLLTLVMIIGIFTSVPVTVNAADVNNLTFELNEDGESYSVIQCDEYAEGELVIPNTYDGLSVTSIGNSAFRYCTNLTTITIPDSVTSIGSEAFYACDNLTSVTIPDSVANIGAHAFLNCHNLTSVTIPDSVTSIGDSAFSYCNILTSITFPDSVTSIGNWAFRSCMSLTSITIPASVTSIGFEAFSCCKSLTSITVDSSNAEYSSVDGVFFNKNKTRLIQYPARKTNTSYTIPDSVTSIDDSAFCYCTNLTAITIPENVMSIGDVAFCYCTRLERINWNAKNVNDFSFSPDIFSVRESPEAE